jgi:transcriptional regulator with XRE-family HTH domain
MKNEKNSSAFAERLKRIREAAGMTQPQLAEKAGMNRFGVAKLEQAEREPSWATVQKLARALGVTCQEFADCEDSADRVMEEKPAAKRKGSKPRGKGK